MTPEYLYQLSNWVDPNELWRQGGLVRLIDMPEEQRRQVDAGVALRRYGAHLAKLQEAHAQQKSLLITPISQYGTTGGLVETPPNHQRLRDCRLKTLGSEPQPDLSGMDVGQAAAQGVLGPPPALKPCPFCNQPLSVTWRKINPKARCTTPDCWGGKLPVLPLDVPQFVEAWNSRPRSNGD